MKLQDLVVVLGRTFKAAFLVFAHLARFYNSASMKNYLVEKFFLIGDKDNKKDFVCRINSSESFNFNNAKNNKLISISNASHSRESNFKFNNSEIDIIKNFRAE
jgi:hypothetical protein